jgi:hypothetical protein
VATNLRPLEPSFDLAIIFSQMWAEIVCLHFVKQDREAAQARFLLFFRGDSVKSTTPLGNHRHIGKTWDKFLCEITFVAISVNVCVPSKFEMRLAMPAIC